MKALVYKLYVIAMKKVPVTIGQNAFYQMASSLMKTPMTYMAAARLISLPRSY